MVFHSLPSVPSRGVMFERKIESHPNREISERTKRNFYLAYSRSFVFRESVYFVNFETDRFRWIPEVTEEITEWWNLSHTTCKVDIKRFYWLWFGFAKVNVV